MHIARFVSSLISLLVIGFVVACSDHRFLVVSPGAPEVRLRVKTITQELPNNLAKVSTFNYDNQGRLNSIITYQSPDSSVAEVEYTSYQYDDQNRPALVQREAQLRPPIGSSKIQERYTYTYNAAGQLVNLSYANGFTLSFSYNSANQLRSSGRQFLFPGVSVSGSEQYAFTGNNLTQLNTNRTLPLRGPSGNSESTRVYTHDNKINPFYGLLVIPAPYPKGFVNMASSPSIVETYFGGVENILNLSRNNVLTETINSETTIGSNVSTISVIRSYQYEYNAADLPTLRRTTLDGQPGEILRFAYEAY